MLNIKSQRKVYFWFCRKYETPIYKIFIIGFLFGFIAWLVRKCSKDIKQAELRLNRLEQENNKIQSTYNKNVSEELGIDSNNLSGLNSGGIEQKINSVDTKLDGLNNDLTELNKNGKDLDVQLKNFVAEKATVLKELEIDSSNLNELNFDDMKKQIDFVYQQQIKEHKKYMDKVSEQDNFINENQDCIKKLRGANKKFGNYVKNTEQIINEMKKKRQV